MSAQMAFGLMITSVLVSSVSQILLKKGASLRHDSLLKEYLNPWVISGYILMIVSTFCVIFAYRGMNFKNGPVIESLGYVLVMILSWFFFKEKVGWNKLTGYALIVVGVAVFYL